MNQDSYLGESNLPPSLHRYLYAYANPIVYIDLDGRKSIFGDATKQLDSFKEWLGDQNEAADNQAVAVGIGAAKLITSLGQGVTGALDVAANVAQEAVGVDDQQVRDELAATRGAVTKGIDFAVNGDYAQAAKNAHQAAVNETTKAFQGDVNATSNVVQGVLSAAMLKGGVKGKAKLSREARSPVNQSKANVGLGNKASAVAADVTNAVVNASKKVAQGARNVIEKTARALEPSGGYKVPGFAKGLHRSLNLMLFLRVGRLLQRNHRS